MIHQRPRGTDDILPDQMPHWAAVETAAREMFRRWGYREIRTPVFEHTDVFLRSIGEQTDIVTKEMFTFRRSEDGESFSLTPEGTAPIVRAYLEHGMHKSAPFQKWYYVSPHFRAERPAAGRRRQFNQIGVEALGVTNPLLDAETILMIDRFFRRLGLEDYVIEINGIGSHRDRQAYASILRSYLEPQRDVLCHNCQDRFERNPLRILDCKVETCKAIVAGAPSIEESLSDESRAHVDAVKSLLVKNRVEFRPNIHLIRGLDYYTQIVYEVVHLGLETSNNAIGGGGRYDNLIEQMGGPSIGATGWALGVERTLLALETEGRLQALHEAHNARPLVFLAALGDDARDTVFDLAIRLRDAGLHVEMDYESKSLKAQLKAANRLQARYVLPIGSREIETGVAPLKEMQTGVETPIEIAAAIEELRRRDEQSETGTS